MEKKRDLRDNKSNCKSDIQKKSDFFPFSFFGHLYLRARIKIEEEEEEAEKSAREASPMNVAEGEGEGRGGWTEATEVCTMEQVF